MSRSVDVNKEHFKEGLGTFLLNAVNIKSCSAFSIVMNKNLDYRRSNWHLGESLQGGIHCWKSNRQKHWHLHMTDLFTRPVDIASYPWTKQSHLEKCINGIMRTSTLVNEGTLRSTANFSSALSNVNNVEISDLLEFF